MDNNATGSPDSEWLESLFASIDAKDTGRFLGFLTEDALFRFGSAPAVHGHAAITDAVGGFFDSIDGCQHSASNTWSGPGMFGCEGEVLYRRHDGSEIALPFVDIFELREQLISNYKIYMDIAPLYAP